MAGKYHRRGILHEVYSDILLFFSCSIPNGQDTLEEAKSCYRPERDKSGGVPLRDT